MTLFVAIGAVGLACAGLLAWLLTTRARAASRARILSGAWDAFAQHCPEPPPGHDGDAHPIAPHPGPAGEVVVRSDGLCLRLDGHPDRTLWLPWETVRRLSPAEPSGVEVGLAGGLHFKVSALAGRAIWDAQTASLRSGRSSGPAEGPLGEPPSLVPAAP